MVIPRNVALKQPRQGTIICAQCRAKCYPKPDGICGDCRYENKRKHRLKETVLCKHCKQKRANRSCGLCWVCFEDPALRQKFASQNVKPIRTAVSPLPDEPSALMPWEAGYMAMIRARVEKGQQIHHPNDAALAAMRSEE